MSKPEPKPKVGPVVKPAPKQPDTKRELQKLHQKNGVKKGLTDLQKELKLSPEKKETAAQKKEMQKFIEGLLGVKKDSVVSKFLSGIAVWLMAKMGAKMSTPLSDEEVFGKIDKERVKLLESGIISHRGLSEHGKENDKKTIEATLARGEKEVEFDIRLINGQLYLRHDPFEGDPSELDQLSKFEDILALFAQPKYRDAKMFIDIKGGKLVADSAIQYIVEIDKRLGLSGNESLAYRTSFISFNPDALKAVQQSEHMKQSPLYFVYVPTGGSMAAEALFSGLASSNILGKSQLTGILGAADKLGGGTTSYAASMKHSNIYMNGERMFKGAKKHDEQVHAFSSLPSEDILKMIKDSKGGLIVPWGIIKNYPKLFQKAKAKGIRIGVFGFSKPGSASEKKQHKAEVQEALKMGANFIITDYAQMLSA